MRELTDLPLCHFRLCQVGLTSSPPTIKLILSSVNNNLHCPSRWVSTHKVHFGSLPTFSLAGTMLPGAKGSSQPHSTKSACVLSIASQFKAEMLIFRDTYPMPVSISWLKYFITDLCYSTAILPPTWKTDIQLTCKVNQCCRLQKITDTKEHELRNRFLNA